MDFLSSREQMNRTTRQDKKPKAKSVLQLKKIVGENEEPKLLVDASALELKHPLLKTEQIGQNRHENLIRAMILQKLGNQQEKEDEYLKKLRKRVEQMNDAEKWASRADQGNDWMRMLGAPPIPANKTTYQTKRAQVAGPYH